MPSVNDLVRYARTQGWKDEISPSGSLLLYREETISVIPLGPESIRHEAGEFAYLVETLLKMDRTLVSFMKWLGDNPAPSDD